MNGLCNVQRSLRRRAQTIKLAADRNNKNTNPVSGDIGHYKTWRQLRSSLWQWGYGAENRRGKNRDLRAILKSIFVEAEIHAYHMGYFAAEEAGTAEFVKSEPAVVSLIFVSSGRSRGEGSGFFWSAISRDAWNLRGYVAVVINYGREGTTASFQLISEPVSEKARASKPVLCTGVRLECASASASASEGLSLSAVDRSWRDLSSSAVDRSWRDPSSSTVNCL
ncbi:hypothetical protein ANN_11898 [Periplaneta americana]|uniref:Uncharacterized protein n=1 Tax=Periplaneta americana TaxID=6978 RepID=A0ABQ8T6B2_PERAM|nr:hypothetical protein ANN_11898 [Periplaneta americana]